MIRTIQRIVEGERGIDGAGVHLEHFLSRHTMHDSDPLLLLDAFDSKNPDEYIAGFPMHPHRGIETISYVYRGTMVHRDSLGNEDPISDGGIQWMTAGSGILHEENLPPVEHLFGVQLWLNLKADEKFSKPAYTPIRSEEIEEIPFDGGYVRLLAGRYDGREGFISKHQPVDYYDVHIEPGKAFTLDVKKDASITLFTLIGGVKVGEEDVENFRAAILSEGEVLSLKNASDAEIAVLVFISELIREPIAWRPGPIVMNTEEELDEAYAEVENGTFIKDTIKMND
ncbi:MAG: pirin family protein [Peptoniphilus sp.]|nr:pirin family protein [Peptoniphilus sp.]MDD7363146.1 pirin family protein [Bacillota bacterium]MDY6044530.1 pirin family protein [Peptoniphilus sp.]